MEYQNLDLLKYIIEISIKAGQEIRRIYNSGDFNTRLKSDLSPVTNADIASNELINKYLNSTGIPILSEENNTIPYKERKGWEKLWLVDPLDGTKEFLKKNDEFTVNIALIENTSPVLGVIYSPVSHELYYGCNENGSFRSRVSSANNLDSTIKGSEKLPVMFGSAKQTVVLSRSHINRKTEDYIKTRSGSIHTIDTITRGSSIKICMVAEGSADYYPRFGPTMEWDTAAGHAIAKYAGRSVKAINNGKELLYNKEDLTNPDFIVE